MANVILAAREIYRQEPAIDIVITGKPQRECLPEDAEIPPNVKLAGFVSDAEFEELLFNAGIVMDLTTWQNCMVCGAYEGVAAQRPLILSGNEVTRKYFYKGTEFTDNSVASIARTIIRAAGRRAAMEDEVLELKAELVQKEREAIQALSAIIEAPVPVSC